MLKKQFLLLFLIFSLLFTTSCKSANEPYVYTGFYFDTVITLTFYDEKDITLAQECFNLCETYENMLSRTTENSDIWNINHSNGTPVEVSSETYALLEEALYYCELTDGKIDITVAPLMDLWDFNQSSDEAVPPTEQEISTILPHVNYHQIILNDNTVTLKDASAQIDLGFIAKGYIADCLKDYLVSQGVNHALINLGGNISVIGNKPDGTDYMIGIQHPFAPQGTAIDVVNVHDTSVVTSGTYERYFTYNEVSYHHILDATTGFPINNDILSVTIICESSTRADALSTTCFVLGLEQSLEYISSLDDVTCIIVDTEEQLHYSQ